MKRILITVALATLAGCASQQRTVAARPQDPSPPCFDSLGNSLTLAPLAKKIPVDRKSPTFTMLSDATLPTAEEKELISTWVNQRNWCMEQGEAFRQARMAPIFRAILEQFHSQVNALAADLYQGKMTYGQFSQQRSSIDAQMKEKWASAAQQNSRDQQQEFMAIMSAQRPIQPNIVQPYQMPVPTTTICNRNGMQVVCNTR